MKARYFQSPKAHIEGRARNLSKSHDLSFIERRIRNLSKSHSLSYVEERARDFFKSHGTTIKEELGSFVSPKTYKEGRAQNFFQVPWPHYRGGARKFCKFEGRCRGESSEFS